MLIYLYGPDSYRRRQKLKEIINLYESRNSSLALIYFDLENDSLKPLFDFVGEQSLFGGLRLGIVSGWDHLKKTEQKEYIKLLKDNLSTKEIVILILEEESSRDLKFLLKKPVVHQRFFNLEELEFKKFILNESKRRDLFLDDYCLKLLAQIYEDNAWGLITELDKLSLLNERKIDIKKLEGYLDAFLPINTYKAIDNFKNSRRISARLSVIEELFFFGEDPAKIFNLISFSPYMDISQKQKIADYDAAVKSGKLEYEEVLLDLSIKNS